MFGKNKEMYLLAKAYNMHCYGHVLKSDGSHVQRKPVYFEVDGQKDKKA